MQAISRSVIGGRHRRAASAGSVGFQYPDKSSYLSIPAVSQTFPPRRLHPPGAGWDYIERLYVHSTGSGQNFGPFNCPVIAMKIAISILICGPGGHGNSHRSGNPELFRCAKIVMPTKTRRVDRSMSYPDRSYRPASSWMEKGLWLTGQTAAGGEGPVLKAFMSCNLQWRYNGLKLRTIFRGASSVTRRQSLKRAGRQAKLCPHRSAIILAIPWDVRGRSGPAVYYAWGWARVWVWEWVWG